MSTEKEFSVAQVQDKFLKMKAAWALTKTWSSSKTGNGPASALPLHYDVMMEFWSDKKGFQRYSLMSTDEALVEPKNEIKQEQELKSDSETDKSFTRPPKTIKAAKPKSYSEALDAGLMATKDGLIHLGTSMAATQAPAPAPPSGATLDDVLRAIQGQSDTMAQLLNHLVAQKDK
ncbi:hypothetical protein H310_15274 [Aphanomyces invadans]|uniref:Uncharacterized protein n=1 Tax=Aphanomyces invadans TaxID=157072 RepID=A0A024T8I3_9STRA|nr:hypothetical protein H310_15274 [Aphanomyces invadans]ETV89886.1 hypothetical protein H310_15274 [Aphanomyces invadans]|eukprot:XP_008881482.1 hypothetical protein H310_15274 [Aphanomyces invadans]